MMDVPTKQLMPPVLESNRPVNMDAGGQSTMVLKPADWVFGRGDTRMSMVLGASVAMIFWAPRQRMAAIAICTHPARAAGEPVPTRDDELFGDEVVRWADERFMRAGCDVSELELSLVGGAVQGDTCIGPHLVSWAQCWATRRLMKITQQDVGGRVVRRLTFNMADGSLTIAHGGRLGSIEV